jgi:hypothetical protein
MMPAPVTLCRFSPDGHRSAHVAPPAARAALPAKARRRFQVLPDAMKTFNDAFRQTFAGFTADNSMALRGE